MSETYRRAAEARSVDASGPLRGAEPLINCVMLVRWPARGEMIQEAISSFLCQDYPHRVLTVVNDGAPCHLTEHFFAAAGSERPRGMVVQAPSRRRKTSCHIVDEQHEQLTAGE